MPRFKTRPPELHGAIERPRLQGLVRAAPVVVLAAPAGHGKTFLCRQIADATDGPTAWFVADELDRDRAGIVRQLLDSLRAAWRDIGPSGGVGDEDAAVPLLGATMETLAGPGCVVMEDVHLLPAGTLGTLVKTAVAALPRDCRLVIATRAGVPDGLLGLAAMGRAVLLGPADLVFDPEECARVCGDPVAGAEIHARTGGWPLAVALLARAAATSVELHGRHRDHVDALADLALANLAIEPRQLLVVLARLPRFPTRLLKRLGGRYAALSSFARTNPALFQRDDDWWAPREWLRDVLRTFPADQLVLDATARALADLDEIELATQLLLAEQRNEEAVPLLEQLAGDGIRAGRPAWVRALLAGVPASARTFTLDLLAATAARKLDIVDPAMAEPASEAVLAELVERASVEDPGALLRARALLATHYYMAADPRALAVLDAALGDALRAPPRALAGRWSGEDAPAAAELLRYYGSFLLFTADRALVAQGRALIDAALVVLDDVGLPTISQRAWSVYVEAQAFVRSADEAVRPVRLAAHQLTDLDHGDAVVRLAELATLEFFAGDHTSARRTIELGRECAHQMGNSTTLPVLASIEVALDVFDAGYRPEHGARFDDIVAELAAKPTLAKFVALITVEFGIVLVRRGRPDLAGRFLERAEAAIGGGNLSHVTALRCRRLRGLVLLAEGSRREGVAELDAVRRDAAGEGRTALVELVTRDLDEPVRSCRGAAPIVIEVLAPELRVSVTGAAAPTPRGYPAKLLALLVATRGLMTVDEAIEALWPGADPEVGRNRLHVVLLRLRRSLGLRADGPISCTEGLVRMGASPQLEVDSWEFERLAAAASTRVDAAARYGADVLSTQFAYDDTIADYRRALRQTFLRVATELLNESTSAMGDGELTSLARLASRLAPDDEDVCRASARTLRRCGLGAEARGVVAATAAALESLGLDGDAFRLLELGRLHAPDRVGAHGRKSPTDPRARPTT